MAKAATKTTTTTKTDGDAPAAMTSSDTLPGRDENGVRTEPGTLAKRAETTLVQPDPDAEPTEPVSLTVDKNATKEQFAAADAAAARSVSGL